jgi:RNA polymerase sigma factor (sigma-70 family)
MAGERETGLLTRAANGETEAFRELFETHHAAMFRLAYRLTSAVDAAEDIMQECFLRLMRNPGFDHERGSLRQYLYGMVWNLVRQRWQANGREIAFDEAAENKPSPASASVPDAIASAEVSEVVQAALASLPVLQREAIVLFEFEELSLEETAAVVGSDVGTVKSRLHRARERLRRSLAPYRNQHRAPAEKGVNHESAE